MFTIWGGRQRFCDGITRRNFLRIGACGAGLTLADMLRARDSDKSKGKPRPRSAIMVYLPGGPPHIDMHDPKPEAPDEYRGDFRTIPTRLPGVHFSELLPRQAAILDKLVVIRSLTGMDGEHDDSQIETGFPKARKLSVGHPPVGAVVSKLRAQASTPVPPFVSLRGERTYIAGTLSVGLDPGYLGAAHRPFVPDGAGLGNLRLADGVDRPRVSQRRQLLESFDTLRRDLDHDDVFEGMDACTTRAFDMILSGNTHRALDLGREAPAVRDRYKGAEPFLLARRLVEAGVGCVTLAFGSWDSHARNFPNTKHFAPRLDAALANLIEDLHDRGLQDDVITLAWGEFGRTPKINRDERGRDHWSGAMSAVLAGGGLSMGQVLGATDAKAAYPRERPLRVPQVLATLYRTLGIDPEQAFPDLTGRPQYLLDDREPIREL
ncbi:MAG: DUF1501 domain-containing protein [Gemmataceae bacterium]